MWMIEGEVSRRRSKFRDYQELGDEQEEDELIDDSNGINPFLIVFFVVVLTLSIALLVSYSVLANAEDAPGFDVKALQRKEPMRGAIWSEIDPFLVNVVYQSDLLVINDWKTSSYGNFRGLLFKSSNGVEGGHTVQCSDPKDPETCKSDWDHGFGVPPFEYSHTMAMALLASSSERQCPQDTNKKVLHVGLGPGTLPSFVEKFVPSWEQHSVELLEEVISIAPYFGLKESEQLKFIHADADSFFDQKCYRNKYDIITLDAYNEKDEMASSTGKPDIVSSCLERNGVVVVNLVPVSDRITTELIKVVHKYTASFLQVFLLESAQYHKILVATNQDKHISHEEFYYRTEFLHQQCDLPILSRGIGHWYDAKQSTPEDLEEWFRENNHKRPCHGFMCLF